MVMVALMVMVMAAALTCRKPCGPLMPWWVGGMVSVCPSVCVRVRLVCAQMDEFEVDLKAKEEAQEKKELHEEPAFTRCGRRAVREGAEWSADIMPHARMPSGRGYGESCHHAARGKGGGGGGGGCRVACAHLRAIQTECPNMHGWAAREEARLT